MFFESWFSLLRIVVVGTAAYAALVVFIHIFGKRTLSKMNAFDFVVTVALGSTLATVLLSKDVVLVEGLLALVLLCSLQFVVAYLSVRSRRIESMVKSEPALLLYRGQFLNEAMRRERITQREVLAALRSCGVGDVSLAEAAVLESDGSVSVITSPAAERSTLPDA
ncbi:DUF421 domain-containing protein [Pseudorhodoplanes sp.]|uniref:DUF421 domain-containing protein n=1 Tax=Pseudorhodoplanes sp. TaxID=1934341 RepID=UPI003D1362A2